MKKHSKRYITIFIGTLFLLTTLVSVGFSALNQNLNISSDVEYETHSSTLYNVLKRETNIGTYAKEYTGNHRDSFTENPTKNVYYWKADNDTEATAILDKWNVIFGGFCWQMYRTTDTGGVKLIYNGIPNNGKCNNTGTAQQIGTSKFNTNYTSLADVGYMYNTRYVRNYKSPTQTNILTRTSMTASSDYYYGTGVTYSNGIYTLTGTTQNAWDNTYSSSNGLYTCASTTATTCSTVYYIADGDSSYMYGFSMSSGHLLSYYNTNIVLGTSYTESNGTYTLNGTTTITKLNWVSNYETYKNYYTCGNSNTACTNLKYITTTENYRYYLLAASDNYIYAKDFTYNSGTDTYTLSSDRYQSWEMTDTVKTNLATHHYTCFNDTGTCQTLSYVYYVKTPSNIAYIFYINLTGGKNVEDAINEMLYNNNVNTTNSDIKTYIDNWYQNNMTAYTTYLEDTIFCTNRSQWDDENGWNPNGGSVTSHMYFDYYYPLNCTNITDKFSVSNNKAKLTYPVGLASEKEIDLLDNNNLRKTGQYYWLISPHYFNYIYAYNSYVGTSGSYGGSSVSSAYGVRPVVSLKPETEYASGTGTKDDPYVVDTGIHTFSYSGNTYYFQAGMTWADYINDGATDFVESGNYVEDANTGDSIALGNNRVLLSDYVLEAIYDIWR